MEESIVPEEKPKKKGKVYATSFGIVETVVILAVIALIGFVGFYKWTEAQLEQENADLVQQIADTNQAIDKLKEEKLDILFVAKSLLDRLEDTQILWSGVVDQVVSATPLDVVYRTYTGDSEGRINLLGVTIEFPLIAETLEKVDDESAFEKSFVTSISRGLVEETEEVYTFNLTTEYKGETTAPPVRKGAED